MKNLVLALALCGSLSAQTVGSVGGWGLGTDCAGSLLWQTGSMTPVINTTFGLNCDNVPADGNTYSVVLFWAPFSMSWLLAPVDLTPVGMTGCLAYIPTDQGQAGMTIPVNGGGGFGSSYWTTAIPNDPFLVGQWIVFQALIFNPGYAGGAATTTAAVVRIGDV